MSAPAGKYCRRRGEACVAPGLGHGGATSGRDRVTPSGTEGARDGVPRNARRKRGQRGATLVLVAATLVALLAAAALAIDLGLLYVARSEAQRAADAAALAGAASLASSGCFGSIGGCVGGGTQEAQARAQAEAVGAQNFVLGQAASIANGDVSFGYPSPEEPQITVTVARTAARGNAIPTLFARLFGVYAADVAATATAEAFDPSGSNVPVGYGCVAPFLVPNCDPDHVNVPGGNVNGACNNGTGGAGYFLNPATGALENPGLYSAGGVMGEPWRLHSNAAPSQWYLAAYNTNLASQISNGSGNGNGQSAALLGEYISECAPVELACGATIQTFNGQSVGPADQGVDARINASRDGPSQGQDTINTSLGLPFPITGGANNPNAALVGQIYYGPSDSEVLVPIYDGHALNPGGSTVTVLGFMQLFIIDVMHRSNSDLIDTVVLNVVGCASGGSGQTPAINVAGGAAVPIRLIRQAN